MEARAYTEDQTKKFLKEVNATSIPDIHSLFQQHASLPAIIKTVINFSAENMLALICHALLTDNIMQLNKELLKKAPRWLELHLDLPTDSALTKSIEAILSAIQYSQDKSLNKTYLINLPDNCYLNLSGSNLRDVNIGSRDLSWANLAALNLTRAYLEKVNFSHANLSHACLRESPLNNANFQSANLSGADFTRCILSEAIFIGADLSNSNFTETTLTNVHFFDLEILTDNKLFTTELDRLHKMLENHPQFSALRAAIANDLNNLISTLATPEQATVYNLAYQHPLLKQHRDLTAIRGAINKIHGWFAPKLPDGRVARNPIETHGQETLAKKI